MEFAYSLLVVLEFTATTVALFCLFGRSPAYSAPLALAFAIGSALLTYSFLVQVCFLFGNSGFLPALEMPLTLFSCIVLSQEKRKLVDLGCKLWKDAFVRRSVIFFGLPFSYLILQAIILRPNNQDSLVYNLARNLVYADAGTLFPTSTSEYAQVTLPLGHDLLYHLFLRFEVERGLAFFGPISYLGIVLCSYALVRAYHTRSTAICIAVLVACLPEIVFHATTPKNDLAVTFFALLALASLHLFLKNHRLSH